MHKALGSIPSTSKKNGFDPRLAELMDIELRYRRPTLQARLEEIRWLSSRTQTIGVGLDVGKRHTFTLLVELQICAATLESSVENSQKTTWNGPTF